MPDTRHAPGSPRAGVLLVLFLLLVAFAPASAQAQAPALPTLSTDPDFSVAEGTGATVNATFTVRLSAASTSTVTVDYASANAGATSPADYAQASGTLVFAPGETVKTVDVAVAGDVTDEDDESFQLQLSAPQAPTQMNATILDGIQVCKILDDDPPPTVSVGDVSTLEGTGSNRVMVFTLTLSAPSAKFVTVDYEAVAGTAVPTVLNGSATVGDYTPPTGSSVSLSPGLTGTSVSISIRADGEDEDNETFELVLKNPVKADLGDARGTGTIIDDDGPTVAIGDVTVPAEGASGTTTTGTLTVSLTAASPQPVTVNYVSANDTATAGEDYAALPTGQSLTIPAGATSARIDTTVRGDDLNENDEKYRVTISAPVNATLGDGVGVVTITDDDAAPTLKADGVTITEGTGSSASVAVLDVTLSAPSGRTLLAGYTTCSPPKPGATEQAACAAATARPNSERGPDADFQPAAELLTFNPGETKKRISINITPDADVEENESFPVFVFNASSSGDSVTPVQVVLVDDDLNDANTPRLSIDDVTVPREGDTGTRTATFTVSMDRPLARRVTVDYASTPGTATAPADFTAVAGTVAFSPGERTKTIAVTTVGDTLLEFNQDFRVELAGPVNAKLADGSGLGIITDDDAGGGTLTIGSKDSRGRARSVRVRDLLCAKGTKRKPAKCAGLPVSWTVATAGTVAVSVEAVVPKAGKQPVRFVALAKAQRRLTKGGKGSLKAKRAAGKGTERLVKRVRSGKAKSVRVTMTFTNRFGGRQQTRETVVLAP